MPTKKKPPVQSVKVVQAEIDPIPVEVLAESIRAIGSAVRRMEESGLHRRALALMLSDISRQPMTVVFQVLSALDALERTFILKKGER